jgi:hypothetical protein
MSIWTDLLFLHGHIATPTALALVTSPRPPAPAVAPDRPPPLPDQGVADRPALHAQHPLRVMGQLR